jgi:hypothetical protein
MAVVLQSGSAQQGLPRVPWVPLPHAQKQSPYSVPVMQFARSEQEWKRASGSASAR